MKQFFLICCLVAASNFSFAQDNTVYKKPPDIISKLVLASATPQVSFNDKGDWMAIMERSAAPTLEDLGQPEVKVAGLRINPANFSPSRSGYSVSITLKNVATGKEITIQNLPQPLKASNLSWNSTGDKIAFINEGRSQMDLYIIDVANAIAKKINTTPLNTATGNSFNWVDHQHLMYFGTTASPAAMPIKPIAPDGPVIQENLGKAAPSRTYQDLIKNKYDEDLFRFLATSQLIINDLNSEKKINQPHIYSQVSLSPDNQYFLVQKLSGKLSYLVPFNGFEKEVEIWDINGHQIKKLASLPSSELAPSGFDNVQNIPRRYGWMDIKPHTITWIQPLDGGNSKTKIAFRDELLVLDAPFNGSPVTVAKTPNRMQGVNFINADKAIVSHGSAAAQTRVMELLDLKTGTSKIISNRSTNDAYSDIGTPFTTKNEFGQQVPILYQGSKFIMRNGGASPKGDYPFISIFDLNNLNQEKIWQSKDPYFESAVKLLSYDKSGIQLITSRQSNDEVSNYFVHNLKTKKVKQITQFQDPQPELRQLKKEKITYTRKDGIQLTANLYVDKNYNVQKDGPLPVVIIAYPREYKSSKDAAQVRGSQNTFTQLNYGSFVYFALKGYAILDNAEFPIVGEGSKYPNDNFVEQLEWNAKAAIDKIASMGVGDSTRVAVTGHSYGAFMTANLLAHTKLFKAGIARSGAYNRTLTPFGFQNEERTYWQAPEVYYRMSPFSYANKIKTPILIIHGEMDNNPGTFPIQSERLYNAIKGNGGTARYVQLPFESHGYAAKENILHLLWEEYQFLEKYVKPKK